MVFGRLARKSQKLRRYHAVAHAGADAQPFFWHVGRPNFGDDINPAVFARLGGRPVGFCKDRERCHFLGIGSILDRATRSSTVLGSGFLSAHDICRQAPARVVSVRGELSRQKLGADAAIQLGDPLVLIDRIAEPPAEKRYRCGFVPHCTEFDGFRAARIADIHLIDPAADPWQVVEEIAACERILSQSLHGLIVADAFDVPNLWVAPGARMKGGRFKFDDYFTTLHAPKTPHPASAALIANPPPDSFDVGRYRFDKSAYLARLTSVLEAGPDS